MVFAPTHALGGTNGQNIKNQHCFSQFQQIRNFHQIQSFQNDFKLYRNQLPFVKPISGYVNLMLQRHVSQIGIIFSQKPCILYNVNCLFWDRYVLLDIILFELIRISLIILISLSMDFDTFLYRKSKFLNHLPFINMIQKMNRWAKLSPKDTIWWSKFYYTIWLLFRKNKRHTWVSSIWM